MAASAKFPVDAVAKALNDSATFATILHLVFLTTYGEEVYELDPLELYARIQSDYGAIMPEELENKWNAIHLAVTTDGFYSDPEAFTAICNSLYEGEAISMDGLDNDLSLPEILWAVYETGLNVDTPPDFTPAVDAVIALHLDDEAPDIQVATNLPPYYEAFIDDMKVDLQTQLLQLGMDPLEVQRFVE